jgi:hypothetical protein
MPLLPKSRGSGLHYPDFFVNYGLQLSEEEEGGGDAVTFGVGRAKTRTRRVPGG